VKIGEVFGIVEFSILVKPDIKDILDLNNLLFFSFENENCVLGKIKDVIGNILCPYYLI